MYFRLNTAIIVPARLASVRFPRKLLAEVSGKPLILHTADRLNDQVPELDLFFAVDGEELGKIIKNAGYEVIMTNPKLASGTDRIAEANRILGYERVINVQADEPMVSRSHIMALKRSMGNPASSISTLAVLFENEADFQNPNKIKVVVDQEGLALYFSRSPIPFQRDFGKHQQFGSSKHSPLKHLGMYAYSKSFLENFSKSVPTALEEIEKLEQLRAIELGYKISVSIVSENSIGIDVEADLHKFESLIKGQDLIH